mmetsp:Transcript_66212/g.157996  ORF Transcript_66212/g.157996 Transcript_66212/m.157996 type:complete len:116 (+) Transcript_66212:107-454(+)
MQGNQSKICTLVQKSLDHGLVHILGQDPDDLRESWKLQKCFYELLVQQCPFQRHGLQLAAGTENLEQPLVVCNRPEMVSFIEDQRGRGDLQDLQSREGWNGLEIRFVGAVENKLL